MMRSIPFCKLTNYSEDIIYVLVTICSQFGNLVAHALMSHKKQQRIEALKIIKIPAVNQFIKLKFFYSSA